MRDFGLTCLLQMRTDSRYYDRIDCSLNSRGGIESGRAPFTFIVSSVNSSRYARKMGGSREKTRNGNEMVEFRSRRFYLRRGSLTREERRRRDAYVTYTDDGCTMLRGQQVTDLNGRASRSKRASGDFNFRDIFYLI